MKESVSALYLKRVESDEWRPGWAKVLHQEESRRPVPVSYTYISELLCLKMCGMALIMVILILVLCLMLQLLVKRTSLVPI